MQRVLGSLLAVQRAPGSIGCAAHAASRPFDMLAIHWWMSSHRQTVKRGAI
jgi:hypothetical protein